MKQNSNQTTERWGIRYTGIVQGVGLFLCWPIL